MTRIIIPVPSLVLLIGPSGSGKSTWAARHFGPYELVSSDKCRAMIADSEADQSVTPAAFDLLRFIAEQRLAAGRLAVIDATNVHASARRRNLDLAAACGVPAVAIVFNVPLERLLVNNERRAGRVVDKQVVHQQRRDLDDTLLLLEAEGFAATYFLDEPRIKTTAIERVWTI